jgi:hypothetical protein
MAKAACPHNARRRSPPADPVAGLVRQAAAIDPGWARWLEKLLRRGEASRGGAPPAGGKQPAAK